MAITAEPYLPFWLWQTSLKQDAILKSQEAIHRLSENLLFYIWMQGSDPTVEAVTREILSHPKMSDFYFEKP